MAQEVTAGDPLARPVASLNVETISAAALAGELTTTTVGLGGGGSRRGLARVRRGLRMGLMFVLAVLLLCGLWELYKAVGPTDGGKLFGVRVLARTDDASMPHVWDVLSRFGKPEVASSAGGQTVGAAVFDGVWFTFRVALAGLGAGIVVGLLLAALMQRFRVAERGLLPYVVLSQTVPLVALAPMVVGWGGRLHLGSLDWQPWMSVAVIAAYLAFFPISVGALRGLQAPPDTAVELMRSYSASWWQTIRRLRLPAAVPYLIPALRLGAASAVIGAVVAEISTGTRGGVGRLIIGYLQNATTDPTEVYTAVLGAAVLGLAFAGLVTVVDLALSRYRPAQESA